MHRNPLKVWVDGHGVVHRIGLGFEMISEVYPVSADNLRQKANGTLILTVPNKAMAAHLQAKLKKAPRWQRVIIHIAPPGSGAPHRQVQITALTVSFSGIGQPHTITAPAHAIQQYGHG